MADLNDIQHLSGALRELQQLLPTQPYEDFQRNLTGIAMAAGQGVEHFGELTKSIEDFSAGTNMSRSDLARYTADFAAHSNKLAMSTQQFQKIAQLTSKTDPFNTELRLKQLNDLTRRYGAFTADFASDTKRQEAALKAMVIAIKDGDQALAGHYLALSRGEGYSASFVAKMDRVGAVFRDTRLNMAGWIGESKILDGALSLLEKRWVSQGVAVFGVYKGMQGISTIGRAVSTLARGGVAAGGGGVIQAVAPAVGRGMLRRFGGGIAAAGIGTYEAYSASPEERPRILGGTAGAVVGGTVGGFFGNIPGAVIGSWIGEKAGSALVDYFKGSAGAVGAKPVSYDQQLQNRYQTMGAQIQTSQLSRSGFGLATELYDPEQMQARALAARQAQASQMQGLGMIGPGAGLSIAQQQIQYAQGLINSITTEHENYIKNVAKSQEEINTNTLEFNTIIAQLHSQQLNQVQTARRSILEQLAASVSNAPNGTYTMPGGLSDRQKYGGSYYENMPLVDITNRPRQPKYQDMTASFQPIINTVMSSMRGHAGGGLIPGAPSSRDNTISAVASGEYVVNAGAVQHYGAGVFDALNRKAAPRFAGGGWVEGALSSVWGNAKASVGSFASAVGGNLLGGIETGRDYIRGQAENIHFGQPTTVRADIADIKSGAKAAIGVITTVATSAIVNAAHLSPVQAAIAVTKGIIGVEARAHPALQVALTTAKALVGMELQAHPAIQAIVTAVGGVFNSMTSGGSSGSGGSTGSHFLPYQAGRTHNLDQLLAINTMRRRIRVQVGQHHWHPDFGTSPLHMGRLGGKTHNLTHRYFEDDIFNGGGRVSAGRHIGHDSKAQSGDVQLVIKEIRTAANTIVQGFRGFTSNLANS